MEEMKTTDRINHQTDNTLLSRITQIRSIHEHEKKKSLKAVQTLSGIVNIPGPESTRLDFL